jgi:Immunoglobulin I-set domain/Immunoglobulin domain
MGFAMAVEKLPANVPLSQLSPTLYQTEHCLFIIDSTVTWSSPTAAYNDIYAAGSVAPYFPRLEGYFDTLTTRFPGNYFSVCYIANTGASNVPNYIDRIYKATGISNGIGSAGLGSSGVPGAPQSFASVDMCRYNLPGGNVIAPVLAVFDHEIGHAWGAQIFYTLNQPSLSNGHWLGNSTVDCQMGGALSTDGYLTVNKINGDPVRGFHWQRVNNSRSNDAEVFSEQALYLMGVAPVFPTSYVLNAPVYNPDGTMGYSSVDTFDHATAVATYGVRSPDYKTSPKQFRLGFVYVARDLAEVNTVCQAVEQSIENFCNGETLSATTYRSQAPFLVDSRYRASVDGLLSELDGNARPLLTVNNSYVTSADGTATISFSASDPDGPAPVVSIVPASSHCVVSGATVQLSGLPDGVHFFTLKATDSGNKQVFAHFTVEVQRPVSSISLTADPVSQTAIAGNTVTLGVAASSGAPLTYHWFIQQARTSTWNSLSNGGAYSGTDTATLQIATAPAMDGDAFLCLVTDASGSATSRSAGLIIGETVPGITSQPVDKNITASASTYFSVAAGTSATTFGYYQYQWQRQAAGSGVWLDLVASSTYAGVTQSQFTVYSSTLGMSGDQFRCAVTNTAGTTTSSAATLSVGLVPSITTQPLPVTGTVGQTVSFSVTASGTGPLSYQWYKYSTPIGNSATLMLANLQLSDAGTYGVHVTNAFGLAYSTNVSLTVNAATAPVISVPPQSAHGAAGQDILLTIVSSGSAPITYQWRKEGVNISGATTDTLLLATIQASDAGHYDVVITNAAGSTTSNEVTVTIDAPAVVAPSNVVITIFVTP